MTKQALIVILVALTVLVLVVACGPAESQPSQILFISNRDVGGDLYLMDVDGLNQTRLTDSSSQGFQQVDDNHGSPAAWSPDGSKIALSFMGEWSDTATYMMDADGANLTRLSPEGFYGSCPVWSPDGSELALTLDEAAVYTVDAEGSNLTRLTPDSIIWASCPAWSPDGKRIALFGTSTDGHGVHVMDADGSNVTFVSSATGFPLSWSPDGTKIAMFAMVERLDWADGYGFDIFLISADGSGEVRLTDDGMTGGRFLLPPSWSPDGAKIAFTSERDGRSEIYVMDADGSNQARLTHACGAFYPSWSPDGRKIAYAALIQDPCTVSDNEAASEIFVMDADGSNQTRLTFNDSGEALPLWSPK